MPCCVSEPTSKPVQPQDLVSYGIHGVFKGRENEPMKLLFRVALLGALVLVGVLLALPKDVISSLRAAAPWVGQAFVAVGRVWPGVDTHHALAFAVLGGVAHLGYPRVSARKVMLALAVFAVVSELFQFVVPGREPALGDVVADVVGGMVGFGVAVVVAWPVRRMAGRREGTGTRG